jgi:hypothetical protein
MNLSPETIANDPRWFPHEFDAGQRTVTFRFAERDYWAGKAFLDDRAVDAALPSCKVPIDALPVPEKPRVGFLWHSAFCCSTLIAGLLSMPGRAAALREPQILNTISAAKRRTMVSTRDVRPMFALLGRKLDAAVVVKPNNAAVNLIEDAAAATQGGMVFLYCSLESFMLSVARRPERVSYVLQLLDEFRCEGPLPERPRDVLEATALAWQLQMAAFMRASAVLAPGRAVALDGADFLAAPRATLRALDAHLALGLGDAAIDTALAGPAMRQHAKVPGTVYDAQAEADALAQVRRRQGREIAAAMAWSERLFPPALPLFIPSLGAEKVPA